MIDGTSSDDIIDERIRALAANHFNAPEGELAPSGDVGGNRRRSPRRTGRRRRDGCCADVRSESAPTTIAITPLAPRRSHAAAWRWGAALAAGLVLGIVVDRRIVRDSSTATHRDVADASRVAPSQPSADEANRSGFSRFFEPPHSIRLRATSPSERTTPAPAVPRTYASHARRPSAAPNVRPSSARRPIPPRGRCIASRRRRRSCRPKRSSPPIARTRARAIHRRCSRPPAGRATCCRARGSSSIHRLGATRRCGRCSAISS